MYCTDLKELSDTMFHVELHEKWVTGFRNVEYMLTDGRRPIPRAQLLLGELIKLTDHWSLEELEITLFSKDIR